MRVRERETRSEPAPEVSEYRTKKLIRRFYSSERNPTHTLHKLADDGDIRNTGTKGVESSR